LALIKARPVAGDIKLGHELLEELNSFRYPHSPRPSFFAEISGLKKRIEKETLGIKDYKSNIKTGYGGIREIEFVIQALQLMHGGKNPFLQTTSNYQALEQLSKYGLISKTEHRQLKENYNFLRIVANRLQMREEKQCHTLPADINELKTFTTSLGFKNEQDFLNKIHITQEEVHQIYSKILPLTELESTIQDWILFLSGKKCPQKIQSYIMSWFGSEKSAPERLKNFILGSKYNVIT